ncbi:MAG: extracellular solute-binding protein [Solirubrobacteraceae bacterium]
MRESLEPGDLFAGCRIESIVGRGGMGVVYKARQLRPQRIVALKVIKPEVAADADFRARFEREASLAAQIEHHNVIPIYDHGDEEGTLYIVMRFVESRDLAALLRQHRRLSVEHAARIITQTAAALDAAHELGLVHRDVKPANVLVTGTAPHEHVYLTDFGLTKRVTDLAGLTRTGVVVGTADYIAPEQANGDPVDGRSDIYSLGVVLFQLVTGAVPFPRQDHHEVAKLFAHIYDPPPLASKVEPSVPVELDQVIDRALAKAPADRFQSAGDLARAATAAAGATGVRPDRRSPATEPLGDRPVADEPADQRTPIGTPTADEPPGAPPPPRRSPPGLRSGRRPLIAGIVALVVAAAVAGALWPDGSAIKSVDPAWLTSASTGTVTYCTGADNVVSKGATQHKTAVDAFRRKFPGLKVVLRTFSKDSSEQDAQFTQLLGQGSSDCDVFYSDVVWTADFASHKWIYDLSRYAKRRLASFVPGMQAAAVYGGRMWSVPKQADAGLLYYNTRRVRTPPQSWQEVYRLAEPNLRLRYQADRYEGLTVNFLELAYAAGATNIVTSDGKAHINQQATRDALQFMVDGFKKGAVPQVVARQKEDAGIDAFGNDRADFMRNWPYAYTELHAGKYPLVADHFDVAPLPSWNGGGRASVLGGHMLVISAFSKNPSAALKLVDFLTSTDVIKRDATQFSLAPALTALWSDPAVQRALPAYAALKTAVFNARSRPVIPNYPAVSRAIYENVNRALVDPSITPTAALAQANYEMQKAIGAR